MGIGSFDSAVKTLLELSTQIDEALQGESGPDPYKDIYIRTVQVSDGVERLVVQKEGGNIFTRLFNWCKRALFRDYYVLVIEDPFSHILCPTKTAVKLSDLHNEILRYGQDERLLRESLAKLQPNSLDLDALVIKVEGACEKINKVLERTKQHKQKNEQNKAEQINTYFNQLVLPKWEKTAVVAADPNLQRSRHYRLGCAIHDSDVEEVKRLANLVDLNHVDLDQMLRIGDSFVHQCIPDKLEVLKILLSKGADINLPALDGRSTFQIAMERGCKEEGIRALLQLGLDPFPKVEGEYVMLTYTKAALRPLLELDSALFAGKTVGQMPLLNCIFVQALEKGCHDVVRMMLNKKLVDFEVKDHGLSIGSRFSYADPPQPFLGLLLRDGPSVTPFLEAFFADKKNRTSQELSSLIRAVCDFAGASSHALEQTITALEEIDNNTLWTALFSKSDQASLCPLDRLCKVYPRITYTHLVRFLLEHDRALLQRDASGQSWLHHLIEHVRSEIEWSLGALFSELDKNSVNQKDANGCTPLYLVCQRKNFSYPLIQNLVRAGGDFSIAAKNGKTALHELLAQPADDQRYKNDLQYLVNDYVSQGGKLMLAATVVYPDGSRVENETILHMLIRRNADITISDNLLNGMIIRASQKGEDLTLRNEEGQTLFLLALQSGYRHAADALLAHYREKNIPIVSDETFDLYFTAFCYGFHQHLGSDYGFFKNSIKNYLGWECFFATEERARQLFELYEEYHPQRMHDLVITAKEHGKERLFINMLAESGSAESIDILRELLHSDPSLYKELISSPKGCRLLAINWLQDFLCWADRDKYPSSLLLNEVIGELGLQANLARSYVEEVLARELNKLGSIDFTAHPKIVLEAFLAREKNRDDPLAKAIIYAAERTMHSSAKFYDEIRKTKASDDVLRTLVEFAIIHKNLLTIEDEPLLHLAVSYLPGESSLLLGLLQNAKKAKLVISHAVIQVALMKGYRDIAFDLARYAMSQGNPFPDLIQSVQTLLPTETVFLERFIAAQPVFKNKVADENNLLPEEKVAYYWQFGMQEKLKACLDPLPLPEKERLIFAAKAIEGAITLDNALPLAIDQTHLQRAVPEIKMPEPPEGVTINTLVEMFTVINFDDPNRPGYISPRRLREAFRMIPDGFVATKGSLKKYLETYINRVQKRVAFGGTPLVSNREQLEQFYKKIESSLKVLVDLFQQEEDLVLRNCLILDLAVAGYYCGSRYFKEPKEIYSALRFSAEGASLEGQGLVLALRLRTNIISYLANQLAHNTGMIPHAENYLFEKLTVDWGVPKPEYEDGYATIRAFKENYTNQVLSSKFAELYTAVALMDHFLVSLNEQSREMKELFIDWLKENRPDWYEKGHYEPILKAVAAMPTDTSEARQKVSDYLIDRELLLKDTAFTWSGFDPMEAIESAKKSLNASLRGKLNVHIALLQEQEKPEELVAFFESYGVPLNNPCTPQELSQARPILLQKVRDTLLQGPTERLQAMMQANKSREEIKAYLDSVTLAYVGLVEVPTEEKTVFLSQPLCTLGDFFPRQAQDPVKYVQEVRAQKFAESLMTSEGRFTKEAIVFYLLAMRFLK